jgi:hypothetical protein
LYDVYDNIFEFSDLYFKNDVIVKQLIAIDYYLHHKTKPPVKYLQDLEKTEKNALIIEKGLNHNKFRFIILQLDFDFYEFHKSNTIISKNNKIIIKYSGIDNAVLI